MQLSVASAPHWNWPEPNFLPYGHLHWACSWLFPDQAIRRKERRYPKWSRGLVKTYCQKRLAIALQYSMLFWKWVTTCGPHSRGEGDTSAWTSGSKDLRKPSQTLCIMMGDRRIGRWQTDGEMDRKTGRQIGRTQVHKFTQHREVYIPDCLK